MKNDGRCAYGQTARSAFFRGVEPEAAQNARAARGSAASERGGSKDPQLRTRLPAVTVELEAALQALDAAFDLGQVVRLAAARAGGVFGIEVDGGSGTERRCWSGRRVARHRPNTIRSSLSSATVARSISAAHTTQVAAAAANASGPGA